MENKLQQCGYVPPKREGEAYAGGLSGLDPNVKYFTPKEIWDILEQLTQKMDQDLVRM